MSHSETFFNKVSAKYGTKFDMSKAIYVNAVTPITVICSLHGEFITKPDYFLRTKHGCSKCANQLMGADQKDRALSKFLCDSPIIHNNKYSYSQVVYTGAHNHVTVVCPDHGPFPVTPTHHMAMKVGCPVCGNYNRAVYSVKYFERRPNLKSTPGKCYAVLMQGVDQSFVKIGITRSDKSFKTRMKKYKSCGLTVLDVVARESTLFESFTIEQHILKTYSDYRCTPLIKFDGWTECIDAKRWDDIRQELR